MALAAAGATHEREGRSWLLHYGARPWSLNSERNRSWHDRDKRVREWRDAFALLARTEKVPRLTRIGLHALPVATGRLTDPGNTYPAIKAALDGLVIAHVVPDDTGEHVAWITMHAPVRGRPGLLLRVVELL